MNKRTSEELQVMIEKAMKARKITRERATELFNQAWKMKYAKDNLDYFLRDARILMGRRKGSDCPALGKVKHSWGATYYHSCKARELSVNAFSPIEDLFRNYCSSCKWTKEQAQTRMMILRIKNGGNNEN